MLYVCHSKVFHYALATFELTKNGQICGDVAVKKKRMIPTDQKKARIFLAQREVS